MFIDIFVCSAKQQLEVGYDYYYYYISRHGLLSGTHSHEMIYTTVHV